MKNKTLFFVFLMPLTAVLLSAWLQLRNQSNLAKCSYLDPIAIDIIAFLAALFLIVEGLVRVFKNKSDSMDIQLTRMTRVSIGFAVLTLHIIQFLYK